MRHKHLPSTAKEDEHKQHGYIEPGVQRRSHEVVVALPRLEAAAEEVPHADVADEEARDVARRQVAVEVGYTGAEDGDVPWVGRG